MKSDWFFYLRDTQHVPNMGILDLPPHQEHPSGAFLLAHTKLESTVRYLGIEVEGDLEMAEQTKV